MKDHHYFVYSFTGPPSETADSSVPLEIDEVAPEAGDVTICGDAADAEAATLYVHPALLTGGETAAEGI